LLYHLLQVNCSRSFSELSCAIGYYSS
jgi:hypothetical protein